MSDKTGIEWTDATWNPVTGCTEVSPGCDHCYAKTFAERWRDTEGHYFENGFDVQLRPDKLDQPLRWKKPRKIFVNSMSDLFHDQVPDTYIAEVFQIMARATQHTFQVLTKRHGRMRSLLSSWANEGIVTDSGWSQDGKPSRWGTVRTTAPLWTPPPNVWLGVSAENQQWADIRIPALLDTPAAVRFVSAEPLLGPIDLVQSINVDALAAYHFRPGGIDWVIVGGESGRGARPMHPDWARGLRDQCTAAGVAFLFKQWGEHIQAVEPQPSDRWLTGEGVRHDEPWNPGQIGAPAGTWSPYPDVVMRRVGKKAAGRELDGRTWDEYPGGAA